MTRAWSAGSQVVAQLRRGREQRKRCSVCSLLFMQSRTQALGVCVRGGGAGHFSVDLPP